MSVLHLASSPTAFELALSLAGSGDSLMLMDEACIAVLDPHRSAGFEGVAVFVMKTDLSLRGIDPGRLPPGVKSIESTGLVELVAQYRRIQGW